MARSRARPRKLPAGAYSEVLLDTARVQVVRCVLMPGKCIPHHRHHCPFIVMPRTDGQMERVVRRGRRQLVKKMKFVAGQPYFRDVGEEGLEQRICNRGHVPVIFEKYIFCPPRHKEPPG